ncbi:hypothetical protein LCGC14_1292790 [marine sediment metagenome]|uniref:Uncharacterized protein n=1 Tax=marine sediment metagenome TaxID=412755 RepID=A0A0F9LCS9_9ZZZZ
MVEDHEAALEVVTNLIQALNAVELTPGDEAVRSNTRRLCARVEALRGVLERADGLANAAAAFAHGGLPEISSDELRVQLNTYRVVRALFDEGDA